MFKRVMFCKYYHSNSLLHQINPTAKIISAIILLISCFIINSVWLYLLLILFFIIVIYVSKVPIKMFLYSIRNIKMLLIFLIVFNLLIMRLDIINITIIILKIISLVIISSLLTFTTKINSINKGIENVLYPLKILKLPISEIALIISLTIRFIPTIFTQAEKILKSQASRGVDFRNDNFKGKIIALSSMLIPMFILSFKRADDLANIMEVRLYGYTDKRTDCDIDKWTKNDTIVVIVSIFMLLLCVVGEVI
ncbi:MAG: energy-coupling factor transporter transmembrane protein EcfT [Bacilli bacterium]